jgi:hypothetical protein
MPAKETPDYYQLLGIIRTANADQIRSAFHRFAREHHPDKLYDEGLERGVVRYSEDRAKETRRTMRPPGGVVLRSSKARAFFTRAHRAMKAEDWPQAKLNLQMAIQNEPDNVELEAKLEEVLQRIKSG